MRRARLQWIDHRRTLREYRLDGSTLSVRVGRHPSCEVRIDDPMVSRHHLLFTSVGGTWFAEAVSDVGAELERRGRRPLRSRRSLAHGDRIHIGKCVLVYADEDEFELELEETSQEGPRVALTAAERDVLDRLCAPVLRRDGPPASNDEIAAALVLSVDGVRSHLKSMYAKFGIAVGTPAQRRLALVDAAITGRHVPLV